MTNISLVKETSLTTVDIMDFKKALAAGAAAFDTRSAAQFRKDGLPGLKHLSLEMAQAGDLPDIPKDEAVYLICERGQVSELVGLYLEAAGFKKVFNVGGGMNAWRMAMASKESGV